MQTDVETKRLLDAGLIEIAINEELESFDSDEVEIPKTII